MSEFPLTGSIIAQVHVCMYGQSDAINRQSKEEVYFGFRLAFY